MGKEGSELKFCGFRAQIPDVEFEGKLASGRLLRDVRVNAGPDHNVLAINVLNRHVDRGVLLLLGRVLHEGEALAGFLLFENGDVNRCHLPEGP